LLWSCCAAPIWSLRAVSTASRQQHCRQWRKAFLAGGEEGLKIRQEDLVDEQGRRMKSVIAELAMENELLPRRIRRMEDEKPFLRWRSKR